MAMDRAMKLNSADIIQYHCQLSQSMKTTLKQLYPHSTERVHSPKTLHLKPRRKQESDTRSVSNNDKSAISTNELLSSISTKLNPSSIEVSRERRWSGITTEKIEIKVSCLDGLRVPRFNLGEGDSVLDFEELRRRFIRRKIKSIVIPLTCVQKNKKLCGDANCPLKLKWKSKLVLELKDAKEAEQLKNYILSTKQQFTYDRQIDKDVVRSFPDKALPRARLTLYHTATQKNNLIQTLRTVLKMLSISDSDVGYVQGMNLFTAVIVSHIKQTQLSFMFVREVLKYGNMRKMYTNNFQNMKELCHHLLHRHIKLLMSDLYEVFVTQGIVVEMFMPFYLSMFACVVDYGFMHSVIDEFMAKGFLFLDKLMLSMLCWMKAELLAGDPGEVACKLGASHIRACELPWDEVINMTQTFELN